MSEYLDVVDEDNRIIGRETRQNIHKTGLWHRGIHILVFNGKRQLILQIRAADKDTFPLHYDLSASEHLEENETYMSAAIRGLQEELGITEVALNRLMRFKMHYGPNDNMISEVYECQFDGPIQMDELEILKLECYSLQKIGEALSKRGDQFASWTKEVLQWYLK